MTVYDEHRLDKDDVFSLIEFGFGFAALQVFFGLILLGDVDADLDRVLVLALVVEVEIQLDLGPLLLLFFLGLLNLLVENLIRVIALAGQAQVHVQIVDADRLCILGQFDVIKARAALVNVVDDDQVVDDLQLDQVGRIHFDWLRVAEICVWIQLVNKNVAGRRTEMKQDDLVVDARQQELVLASILLDRLFVVDLVTEVQLQVLVEDAWHDLNV